MWVGLWNLDLLFGDEHFFDCSSLEYSYPSHSIHGMDRDCNTDPALKCDVIAVPHRGIDVVGIM